ncbi:MAG: AtpZ/AtpI family protein [Phycisphaerae bacterium]
MKTNHEPPGESKPSWHRYAGLGTEFAAAVVGLTLAGLWFDYHYRTYPRGVLIGAAIGFVGGMYNLLRSAQRMMQEQIEQQKKAKADDVDQPGG